MLMALTMYADVIGGGGGSGDYFGDREAARLSEARRLLREGAIAPQQHASHSSSPIYRGVGSGGGGGGGGSTGVVKNSAAINDLKLSTASPMLVVV